ncbi:hypothetical protein LCGC14_0756850 [marine sediment metagenome]|uniref:Uncharacterized protein n=1 Tax=marine sediment metagenome TaxID=412755 RepID=A0A0F9Q2D6_9ZZZZ
MTQIIVKIKEPEIDIELELDKIIVLEELPAKDEQYEEVKIKAGKKRVKKALLKLFKKAKYNAKYLEETTPIEKVKREVPYRNHGVF